jgi:spore germination protein GerM
MNRQRLALTAIAVAVLVAACQSGSGVLPPIEGSSAASAAPSQAEPSSDATPGGGSAEPTVGVSPTATRAPTPAASQPPNRTTLPATPKPSSAPVSQAPATQAPVGKTVVRAYFYLGGGAGSQGLVPVLREVPATQAVARAAIEQLIAGPSTAERTASPQISSAVPEGTDLLGVAIADRVATVDLSGAFASGGGSASTLIRLAQVTYTLTQFPTVDRVLFKVDGRVATVFGSEGIVLNGPVARDDYHDFLPAIWVDRPAWRAALGNPARITGLANVFEAQFRVAVLDGAGATLVDESAMATCGTGCWGTFDVRLPYDVASAQWGTLRVYNRSAKDGSVESQRDYPVWLSPGG